MVKQGKNNTRVVTGKCRLAYVNLFTPRPAMDGQTPKYSLCLLIPKDNKETINKIDEAVNEAIAQGLNLFGGSIPKGIKTPLRDGDIERPDKREYAGCYFINASSKTKPGLVDRNLEEISDSNALYSGCYGRASLYFYPYSQGENKGIGCSLRNVQKIEDGDLLGLNTRPQDDFEALDDILG